MTGGHLIRAWRICKQRHATTAFDGYGASLSGGRWNSPGVAVVYTSAVASQALLEMLVHADAVALSLSYVLIPVEFDERLVSDAAELPAGWRDDLSLTRGVGDQWAAASKSPILRVPSALLAVDPNYIINPAHPDRAQIRIGSPQPLIVDERIKALFAGK